MIDTSSKNTYSSNNKYNENKNRGLTQSEFLNMSNTYNAPSTGYCIRTGVPIPFDISRPLCSDAYRSWVQFQNPDFPEKFCHSTGKPSYGKTSMRNPVLR